MVLVRWLMAMMHAGVARHPSPMMLWCMPSKARSNGPVKVIGDCNHVVKQRATNVGINFKMIFEKCFKMQLF